MTLQPDRSLPHCGLCGNRHVGDCSPESFSYFHCTCGETHRMPWDAVAFCGIKGIICACHEDAIECWESIDFEEYTALTGA